ncbi:MAG: hypothetical protein AB1489_06735 [Acidobacteriota bacterium]
MNKQNSTKLFAFKLAKKLDKKTQEAKPEQQWKVREGVAIAGCTFPAERYGTRFNADGGVYC